MINMNLARSYCSEVLSLIENYDKAVADKNEVWDVHHRREIDEGLSGRDLIRRGEYLHRPACELIFLKHDEHIRLHTLGNKNMLGKTHSKETKKKMSQAKSGEKNPNFGKHFSEEARKKISLANSGEKNPNFGKHFSEETKKKMSLAMSGEKNPNFGKHWYNNGVKSVKAKSRPKGFVKGRLPFKRGSQHSV